MDKHGGDIYTKHCKKQKMWIDFSANINPFGMADTVKQAVVQSIDDLVHYPDPCQRKLRNGLAAYHQVHSSHIVCGNGGADIIFRTIQAIQPAKALLPVPTFSEYEKALKETGCSIVHWKMNFPFCITEDLLDVLEQGAYDFLVLCNPNNPTGNLIAPDLMRTILDTAKKKHIFILLDECFLEMTGDRRNSMLWELEEHKHVLIVKSMTKLYAIPGLRLGYGICADSDVIERIREIGQPWPVSILASEAGCAALEAHEYRNQFLLFLQKERKFLFEGLKALGYQVWEPHANYVFFRIPGCNDMHKKLLPYDILLRHCENYVGLNGEYYRASVRTRKENTYLLQCMQEIDHA